MPSTPAGAQSVHSPSTAQLTNAASRKLAIPDDVSLAELPTYFAQLACPLYDGCWNIHVPDCLAEHAREQAQGFVASMRRAEIRGSLRYDGREMARCLRDYEKLTCPSKHPKWLCANAFHGTLALGERCYTQNECAAGVRCDKTNGCPGTCQPKAEEVRGECRSNLDCAEGLECNAGTLPVCYRPRQIGEPCGVWPVRCADTLVCLGDGAGNRFCRPLSEAQTQKLGDECSYDRDELQCRAGAFCSATWNAKGVCVPAAAAFGVCEKTTNESCPEGFRCTEVEHALRCRPWPARGEACVDSDDCWYSRGVCKHGVCSAPRNETEACDEDRDCLSGECVDGHCRASACED